MLDNASLLTVRKVENVSDHVQYWVLEGRRTAAMVFWVDAVGAWRLHCPSSLYPRMPVVPALPPLPLAYPRARFLRGVLG